MSVTQPTPIVVKSFAALSVLSHGAAPAACFANDPGSPWAPRSVPLDCGVSSYWRMRAAVAAGVPLLIV